MKRLSEIIEQWNSKLKNSKGLYDYSLSLEKINTIYYNRDGRVVCYGSVKESEMTRFESRFTKIYYIGEVRLCVNLKVGEGVTMVGEIANQCGGPVFKVLTSEFKRLKKFLKKELSVDVGVPLYKHKMVSMTALFSKYQISLTEELPSYNYPALKEILVYNLEFSDGFTKTLSEKELKYAMDYMMKKNVAITKTEKAYQYA